MGLFGKKEPTWYQQEAARIQQTMMTVAPGSNEYKELMDRLTSLREFAGKEKEMNQFFDKPGRASVIGRVLGILGIGGLAFGLAKMEKIDGNMLTGSSAEAGKGFLKSMFKFL